MAGEQACAGQLLCAELISHFGAPLISELIQWNIIKDLPRLMKVLGADGEPSAAAGHVRASEACYMTAAASAVGTAGATAVGASTAMSAAATASAWVGLA